MAKHDLLCIIGFFTSTFHFYKGFTSLPGLSCPACPELLGIVRAYLLDVGKCPEQGCHTSARCCWCVSVCLVFYDMLYVWLGCC